ncbi:MAG TPA: flagellar biosynthetic protein FliO [Polyangiaceae bacterium]
MTPLSRYVVETLVTLVAVVALAVLLLSALRRAGIGKASGPLELLARLPLDGRRAVYLVRVGETIYVLGGSEQALQKLGELPPGAVLQTAAEREPSFTAVLRRALGLRSPSARGETDERSS